MGVKKILWKEICKDINTKKTKKYYFASIDNLISDSILKLNFTKNFKNDRDKEFSILIKLVRIEYQTYLPNIIIDFSNSMNSNNNRFRNYLFKRIKCSLLCSKATAVIKYGTIEKIVISREKFDEPFVDIVDLNINMLMNITEVLLHL